MDLPSSGEVPYVVLQRKGVAQIKGVYRRTGVWGLFLSQADLELRGVLALASWD